MPRRDAARRILAYAAAVAVALWGKNYDGDSDPRPDRKPPSLEDRLKS